MARPANHDHDSIPLRALALAPGQSGGLIERLGPWLAAGARVYCLDGGNRFDPAPLCAWLRARRLDSIEILGRRVFISRAFTCHQLVGATERLLAPLAACRDPHEPPRLAVVLGLEAMFVDEDLPLFERRHYFETMLAALCRLAAAGLPCLVTYAADTPPAWAGAIRRAMPVCPSLETLPWALESENQHGAHPADLQPGARRHADRMEQLPARPAP